MTYYFAVHPDANCPVYGDPDVEPCNENPIAKAIAEGCRYEERFAAEYGTDIRELILGGA